MRCDMIGRLSPRSKGGRYVQAGLSILPGAAFLWPRSADEEERGKHDARRRLCQINLLGWSCFGSGYHRVKPAIRILAVFQMWKCAAWESHEALFYLQV